MQVVWNSDKRILGLRRPSESFRKGDSHPISTTGQLISNEAQLKSLPLPGQNDQFPLSFLSLILLLPRQYLRVDELPVCTVVPPSFIAN